MVEPFCRRSGKQCRYLSAAARLSENRYVLCVAAKRGYILVYPLKCRHEVEQAGIAGFGVFVAVGGKVEEAEDVETVVERDYHRITFLGKVETVVRGKFLSAACRIAAAVKPHHDGTLLAVVQARSPDVDPQAVFAGIAVVPVEGESVLVGTPAHTHRLGAGGTEHAAAAHAFPFIGRPRGHEALCLGVGNTFIYIDTVLQESSHFARLGLGDGCFGRGDDFARGLLRAGGLHARCLSARGENQQGGQRKHG